MSKKNKWGSVNQIDKRCNVGSEAWKQRHSPNIQHLSAYRHLHQLAEHSEVRHLADKSVSQKLNAIKKLENPNGKSKEI